jgi:hypothetical protein
MVALDETGEALALASSKDIDLVVHPKYLADQDLLPNLGGFASVSGTELLQNAAGRDSGFFKMPRSGLVDARGPDKFDETHLNRFVTVLVFGLALNNDAGAGFDYRNRSDGPAFVENLGHPHFYSDQSIHHIKSPFPVSRFPFPVIFLQP